MTINWTTDYMKICRDVVEELSKSIQISTINKLQQVSHLVYILLQTCNIYIIYIYISSWPPQSIKHTVDIYTPLYLV